MHAVAPGNALKLPAGHSWAAEAPSVDTYEPAGAGVHEEAFGAARKLPAVHQRPTVTVKLADALLPAASTAVQLTVVAPVGNVAPDAGVHATASSPSTRSVAVGSV